MSWIITHYIEILGVVTGLLFLYYEIKESVLLWPLGIITSVFYIAIFYSAKFYADMGLQFYYVVVSFYGWYFWLKGKKSQNTRLSISRLSSRLALVLFIITAAMYYPLGYLLDNFTDSQLPYWDAFTTALSITATWMLARKILEQWLVWVVVDAISMILYIYKDLYPTTLLFACYMFLAFYGYMQWHKTWRLQQVEKRGD